MLAPMAGVSDHAFRAACVSCGAEWTVSEMVSAKALCYEQKGKKREIYPSAALARGYRDASPYAVQLFGADPDDMAQAAHLISGGEYAQNESEIAPSAIDINMGCPVRKVVACGEGSALLKSPDTVRKILRAVRGATSLPVTVKIRVGWDENSINAVRIAAIAEEEGASLITVHGRTREELYRPGVHYDCIAEVKKHLTIPVVGNGDIFEAKDALRMLEETGCDGLMIARGALGNPWIFDEIRCALTHRKAHVVTAEEKLALIGKQFDTMVADTGVRVGTAEAKKHAAWYLKGVRGAAEARNRVMGAETVDEIKEILAKALPGAEGANRFGETEQ